MIPLLPCDKPQPRPRYSLRSLSSSHSFDKLTPNLDPTPPLTPSSSISDLPPAKFSSPLPALPVVLPSSSLSPSVCQVVEFLSRYASDDSSVSSQEFKIFDITKEDSYICFKLLGKVVEEQEDFTKVAREVLDTIQQKEDFEVITRKALDISRPFIQSFQTIKLNRIRIEYLLESSQLVFRMPSLIHDHFISLTLKFISKTIESTIRDHNHDHSIADNFPFKSQLLHGVDGKLSYGLKCFYDKKHNKTLYPDIAFHFYLRRGHPQNPLGKSQSLSCKYPGLIMEVGYSQPLESLRNYARYYLLRMENGVNKVMLVKIDPKTRRAIVECYERYKKTFRRKDYWYIRMCRFNRISQLEIRGLDGGEGAHIDEVLSFELGDLVVSTWRNKDPELLNAKVQLPIRDLFNFINEAFDRQDEVNEGSGSVPSPSSISIWEEDDGRERSMSASFTLPGTTTSLATSAPLSEGGISDMEESETLLTLPNRIAVSPKGSITNASSSTETSHPNGIAVTSKRSNTDTSLAEPVPKTTSSSKRSNVDSPHAEPLPKARRAKKRRE
ncbi:hypothetical protein EAF00_002989 [Botryotinia globosa]|nr:hypothetical protein EAF00_002989 [Botryotinia globosa]